MLKRRFDKEIKSTDFAKVPNSPHPYINLNEENTHDFYKFKVLSKIFRQIPLDNDTPQKMVVAQSVKAKIMSEICEMKYYDYEGPEYIEPAEKKKPEKKKFKCPSRYRFGSLCLVNEHPVKPHISTFHRSVRLI